MNIMRKYFVLFLILTVVFYSFSAQTVEAKSFWKKISDTFNSVVNVAASIIGANFTTNAFTLSFFDPLTFIAFTGDSLIRCALLGQNSNLIENCGSGGVVLIPDVSSQNLGACNYQIPLTFYNQPEMNVNYYYPTSTQYDESGNPFTVTSNVCTEGSVDETIRKIAIYRFTLPSNSNQNTLNNWYYGIKNQVGGGWLSLAKNYYQYGAESSRLVEADYIAMCDNSNICKFTDSTVPQNVYVAYVAKVLSLYNGLQINYIENIDYNYACIPRDNKFLAKTTTGIAGDLGLDATQIIGPMKTAACSPPPTVNLQTADTVSISKPDDKTLIGLGWNSTNADSCIASGDWSGNKSTNGTESVSKSRGNYTFNLSCSGPGGSVSDSVVVNVIQVPKCSFSADPASIILPQTSTLSWSCDYANSCSINQNIGSVSNVSGSKVIRPDKTTNYTLSCNGLDGSNSFNVNVNIGFIPRIKEVNPGAGY